MVMSDNSIQAVNIKQKLSLFNDYWNPRIVGIFNKERVQVVKLKGEFVWMTIKTLMKSF